MPEHRLREIKLDSRINRDPNLNETCCISLGEVRPDAKYYKSVDGKIVKGVLVPHADIVQLLDEAGFLYRAEDICMHNGHDEQAKAFCNDCVGYLMNFVRRVDRGEVSPVGVTAEHKTVFNKLIYRLANRAKTVLDSNQRERTKIYLMKAGHYWERLSLLEAVTVSDITDPDALDCLMYGTIKTDDKSTILVFQIEKADAGGYNVKSAVLRDNSVSTIINTTSQDCVSPFAAISNVLDDLVCSGLPPTTA